VNVSYGPPGARGVTHLVAIGDYEHEFATDGVFEQVSSLDPQTLLLIGAAGVVGYLIGRSRSRSRVRRR
jgi:hypothetical protein